MRLVCFCLFLVLLRICMRVCGGGGWWDEVCACLILWCW